MDKRLQKRHKRQVARAKAGAKPSEPDLRTAEQITAAKQAGRLSVDRRHDPLAQQASSAPSLRRQPGTSTGSRTMTDGT
jgi:hypothetical protein